MEIDSINDFPISVKTKMSVVIAETFERSIKLSELYNLQKLDGTEQNEKHIVEAVNDASKVPTPEFKHIERPLEAKSQVFFSAPPRCFIYDSEFYEPITYYAVTEDIEFIRNFNNAHKFLQMTTRQLEQVFEAIESIVKDGVTESPTLDQTLFLLDKSAPPFPVVQAIYEYWLRKPKLTGSVLKFMEFPPDHCGIRQQQLKSVATKNKQRKNIPDTVYMRRLHSELDEIRRRKVTAINLVEEQKKKRKEMIVFLRQIVRKARAAYGPKFALILEPELKTDDDQIETQPETTATLPQPPTNPGFLRWCLEQHIPDNS